MNKKRKRKNWHIKPVNYKKIKTRKQIRSQSEQNGIDTQPLIQTFLKREKVFKRGQKARDPAHPIQNQFSSARPNS